MRERPLRLLIGAVGVLGGAIALAQPPAHEYSPPLPPPAPEAQRARHELAGPPRTSSHQSSEFEGLKLPSEPVDQPIDENSNRPVTDPVHAVDTFVQQSRSQAEASIKELAAEAKSLRARLELVESAIAKWESVTRALDAQSGNRRSGETTLGSLGVEAWPWRKDRSLPPPEVIPADASSNNLSQDLEPVPDPTLPAPELVFPLISPGSDQYPADLPRPADRTKTPRGDAGPPPSELPPQEPTCQVNGTQRVPAVFAPLRSPQFPTKWIQAFESWAANGSN